jgi:hypothetical protein
MSNKTVKKPRNSSINILNLSGTGPVVRTVPVVNLDSESSSDSGSESSVDFGPDSEPETTPSSGAAPGPRLGSEFDTNTHPTPRSGPDSESPSESTFAAVRAPTQAPGKRKRRSRKKQQVVERRSDFVRYVGYLGEDVAKLDKLRDDLEEAIARVVRVHGAFAKCLNNFAGKSNRVKHILNTVGEVPFHCDLQRAIVSEDIKAILEINDARAAAEKAKQELKRRRKELIRALGLNIRE